MKDHWDLKFVGNSEIQQPAQLGRHEGVTVESYHVSSSAIGRASVTLRLTEAAITFHIGGLSSREYHRFQIRGTLTAVGDDG